jgi:hypothetical protein
MGHLQIYDENSQIITDGAPLMTFSENIIENPL